MGARGGGSALPARPTKVTRAADRGLGGGARAGDDGFFLDGVPFAAGLAAAGPFRGDGAAGLADEAGGGFGHGGWMACGRASGRVGSSWWVNAVLAGAGQGLPKKVGTRGGARVGLWPGLARDRPGRLSVQRASSRLEAFGSEGIALPPGPRIPWRGPKKPQGRCCCAAHSEPEFALRPSQLTLVLAIQRRLRGARHRFPACWAFRYRFPKLVIFCASTSDETADVGLTR